MLELLGVGIARRDGTWLVRGVSARIDRPGLIVVTGHDFDARRVLFDALAGAIVPAEGRVWLGGVPVTLSSRRQIQRLVHDVDLGIEPHAMAAGIVAAIDHARARRAEFLLLRNVDTTSDQRGLDGIAAFLRRVVSTDRLTIVASTRLPGTLSKAAHVTVTLEEQAARVVVA